jgi:FkbM family methyltransferase
MGRDAGIKLFNFGFGNQNTKTSLFSDADESGMASVYKRKLDHFNVNMGQKEEIEIRTLDDFCQDQKIGRIHFLKLDVEGHEIKVLEGAANLLGSRAIDYIQFEFGGCNIDSRTYFQDFYYLLKDNYNIYRIVKNGVHPMTQYREMYEAFSTTNYLGEKK